MIGIALRSSIASLLLVGAAMAAGPAPSPATFNKDVLPILQKNCQTCHRPGEIGPVSFLDYQSARPWAKAIKSAVLSGKMPPWFADPRYGHFSNERKLTHDEIDTMVSWVDNGAPEGSAKDLPAPVKFPEGWGLKPDVVISAPVYHVPATGIVESTYFVVPSGFTKDTWVTMAEVRPSNRSIVHHVFVSSRPPGSSYMSNLKYGEPFVPVSYDRDADGAAIKGAPPHRAPVAASPQKFTNSDNELLGMYVPGLQPQDFTIGHSAKLVEAGSDIIFQMHYTPNGKTDLDDVISIGLVLTKEPPEHRFLTTMVSPAKDALEIPPGDGNFELHSANTFNEDTQLVWFMPHMHLRGKDMTYRLVYPTGESETVLSVPHYNFNWQLGYNTVKPLVVPKGTRLEVTTHFDNSPNNPFNPNPKATVRWGEQSWEEMGNGWYGVIVDKDLDPTKIVNKLVRGGN